MRDEHTQLREQNTLGRLHQSEVECAFDMQVLKVAGSLSNGQEFGAGG